jgi:hypothetical protein
MESAPDQRALGEFLQDLRSGLRHALRKYRAMPNR